MKVNLSTKFDKQPRFDYAKDKQKEGEKSKGPTTSDQISSFNLPEIYKSKLPNQNLPSAVLATTLHEFVDKVNQVEKNRPKLLDERKQKVKSGMSITKLDSEDEESYSHIP